MISPDKLDGQSWSGCHEKAHWHVTCLHLPLSKFVKLFKSKARRSQEDLQPIQMVLMFVHCVRLEGADCLPKSCSHQGAESGSSSSVGNFEAEARNVDLRRRISRVQNARSLGHATTCPMKMERQIHHNRKRNSENSPAAFAAFHTLCLGSLLCTAFARN